MCCLLCGFDRRFVCCLVVVLGCLVIVLCIGCWLWFGVSCVLCLVCGVLCVVSCWLIIDRCVLFVECCLFVVVFVS